MPRPLLAASLSTLIFLTPLHPTPPAQPAAFLLDGHRDPGYVLVAEDPSGDFLPDNPERHLWADLTRLYLATDADHLYVYADLPNYTAAKSSGEIGLAFSFPDNDETGTALDPWRSAYIAYAFSDSTLNQCLPQPISPVRPPAILIRGKIKGAPSVPGNDNNGFTFLAAYQDGNWHNDEVDWGGYLDIGSPNRIAYADSAGVELFIPRADLPFTDLTGLQLSFFTTAGVSTPGAFDSIPPDSQAPAPLTRTVLSQLQTIPTLLPEPLSVALGCDAYEVDENSGTVTLDAQFHTALTQTVSVSYTATALTAGPADFTPVTGTLTFGPGVTRQTISVAITDDTAHEEPETFRLSLANPQSVSLATPLTATITILDDDEEVILPTNYQVYVPLVRR